MLSCTNRAVPERGRKIQEGRSHFMLLPESGEDYLVSLQGLFIKLLTQLYANPIAIQEFGMECFQTSPYDALICYTT